MKKVLHITFVILGLLSLIGGLMDLGNGNDGEFFGLHLDSPWYGILYIVLGSVMLLAAFDYFRKRKLPKIGNKN